MKHLFVLQLLAYLLSKRTIAFVPISLRSEPGPTAPLRKVDPNVRRLAAKSQWITTASTNELVQAIDQYIGPEDVVAELGAQLREVSTNVCQKAASSIHVDVERKFPSNVRQPERTKAMRQPGDDQLELFRDCFHEIPSLDDWRRVFRDEDRPYSVLVLDVNAIVGNDLKWTSLQLVREFVGLFPTCRTVLIKSLGLNQWASRLHHSAVFLRRPKGGNNRSMDSQVLAAVGVSQYRDTVPHLVRPDDMVLEVGCHMGVTTALLQNVTTTTIGVDVGPSIVMAAQKRFPDVFFSVGNAYQTADLLRIQQAFISQQEKKPSRQIGYDVIYVDVGGLSGQDGLQEALMLLESLMQSLEPRYVVIKSLCVQRLASTLMPFWRQRTS